MSNYNPSNTIKILTARLNLRFIELTDLNSIHMLHALPETDRFNTLGIPENIETTEKIIARWISDHQIQPIQNHVFAIEKIMDNQFIGLIALKLGSTKFKVGEVWYKLHSDFWSKGFGTEALNALLNFGFEQLNLHRIEAGCAVENIASIKLLEKVGMQREGRKRKVLPLKTGWSDNFHYAILEADARKIFKQKK